MIRVFPSNIIPPNPMINIVWALSQMDDGGTVRSLSRAIDLHCETIYAGLRVLEEAGFIISEMARYDNKTKIIKLTKQGFEVCERLAELLRVENEEK